MYYTIYKIKNKINDKIYIGKHTTDNLNDSYMGSGKHLKNAIKKYGIENFEKEILYVFNNEEDMNSKEAELVTEDFCDRKDTYNICPGGKGGFGYINSNDIFLTDKRLKSLNKGSNQNNYNAFRFKFDNDPTVREKMYNGCINGLRKIKEKYPNGTFYGKYHTKETKKKMSESASKRTGSKNSQYGTIWITNGTDNKKIKKDIDTIPDGWYKGRVNKYQ